MDDNLTKKKSVTPSKRDTTIQEYQKRKVEPYKFPCFDSSLFCGKFNDEICNWIKRPVVFDWLWEQAANGKFEIRISALTLAEVHYVKRIYDGQANNIRGPLYDEFLKMVNVGRKAGFLKIMEISEKTAKRAHELCVELDILPNDAIIVANALEFKCDAVLAWDGRLTKKSYDGIRIEEPVIYAPGLFRETEIASEAEQLSYNNSRNPPKNDPVEISAALVKGSPDKTSPVIFEATKKEGARK